MFNSQEYTSTVRPEIPKLIDLRSHPELIVPRFHVDTINQLHSNTTYTSAPLSLLASHQTESEKGNPVEIDKISKEYNEFVSNQGVLHVDTQNSSLDSLPFVTKVQDGELRGYGGVHIPDYGFLRFGFAKGTGPYIQTSHLHPHSPEGMVIYSEKGGPVSLGSDHGEKFELKSNAPQFIVIPKGEMHQLQLPNGEYITVDFKITAFRDRGNGDYPKELIKPNSEKATARSLEDKCYVIDPNDNVVALEASDSSSIPVESGQMVIVIPFSEEPSEFEFKNQKKNGSLSLPVVMYNNEFSTRYLKSSMKTKALILTTCVNPLLRTVNTNHTPFFV